MEVTLEPREAGRENKYPHFGTVNKLLNINNSMSFSICFLALEYFGWGKYGGIGRVTRDIATGLAGRGVDVSIIVPRGLGQTDIEIIDGVNVYSFPLVDYHRIGTIIGKVNADIYHSQDPSPGTYVAMRKMRSSMHVLTCQNPKTREEWSRVNSFYGLRRRLFNKVFEPTLSKWVRGLDAVFCQANYIKEKIEGLYTLDYTPEFLPNPVKVPKEIAKSATPQVCFLGRFDGEKNPERFFKLCNYFPGVGFVAGGASHNQGRDESLRRMYGNLSNLTLSGHVMGEEKESLLNRSQVLVNTSVSECLPVSFLEAAAHGCAILSIHDPDGFASRFGVHVRESYEDGLEWLLKNDNWRKKGELGRKYVSEYHEQGVVIDRHMEVYNGLLG